jgi:hypothetical protein
MLRRLTVSSLLVTFFIVAGVSVAHADNFSFTGNFAQDDNVQLFNFTVVGAQTTVTLRTFSYAGGTNSAGTVITRGGFDPILALFNATTGALTAQNDDGTFPQVPMDITGQAFDTLLSSSLAAGNYTVAVMQYDNFAVGPDLSNGFVKQGQGNFTASFDARCTQGRFVDVSDSFPNDCRDSHWAFDILNVSSATVVPGVPEPGSLVLLGTGILGLGIARFRNRQ